MIDFANMSGLEYGIYLIYAFNVFSISVCNVCVVVGVIKGGLQVKPFSKKTYKNIDTV